MGFDFVKQVISIGGATTEPALRFYREGFNLGGGLQWQDIILDGNGSLTLANAKADGLNYLKLFGGTEQRNLPDNYIQREYIYMTEGSYIKVEDLLISAGYRVEYEFRTTSLSTNLRNYIGGRVGGVSAGGGFRLSKLANSNNNRVVLYGFESGTEYYDPTAQFQAETRYKYTYNNGVCTLESGGNVVSTRTFAVTDNTNTKWGINCYGNGDYWQTDSDGIYVYSLKVWNEQGELVMDLVPAVQKGTVPTVCFYDTVTGSIRTATAGTFMAGAEAVPTPDAPMDIICNNGAIKIKDDELPIGYKRILGMTMNNDCFYQTSVYPTGADTLKFSYEWTSTTACNVLGCYTTSSAQDNLSLYIGSNQSAKYLRYNGGTASSYSLDNKRYNVQITPTGSIGMEIEDTWEQKDFTCSVPLCIGITGASATSAKFIGNLYENVEIVGKVKFIPCERLSDNEIGYYDTLNETFIEPTGTTPTSLGYDNTHNIICTDGTTETVEVDTTGDTATAEMLLAVGDYKDVQSVLDGNVTRNVGIKVLDGTEDWVKASNYTNIFYASISGAYYNDTSAERIAVPCTHFLGTDATNTNMVDNSIKLTAQGSALTNPLIYIKASVSENDLTTWQTWLATQYQNGAPVIIVFPLKTPTTETVTAQPLTIQAGTNIVEIVQASIDNLPLEVSYKGTV